MNDSRRVDRLFQIISEMKTEEQMKLLFELENTAAVRKNPRTECLLKADYAFNGRSYQGYLRDISIEGAFIETGKFSGGDELSLTISSDNAKPLEITGQVVRIEPDGLGVKFKYLSQANEEKINSIVSKKA